MWWYAYIAKAYMHMLMLCVHMDMDMDMDMNMAAHPHLHMRSDHPHPRAQSTSALRKAGRAVYTHIMCAIDPSIGLSSIYRVADLSIYVE